MDEVSEKFTSERQREEAEAFASDEPYMDQLLAAVAAAGEGGLAEKLGGTVVFEHGYVSVPGKPFAVEVHADGACAVLYQEGPVHPSQEPTDYLAQRAANGAITYWPTDAEGTTPWTKIEPEFRAFQQTVMDALA